MYSNAVFYLIPVFLECNILTSNVKLNINWIKIRSIKGCTVPSMVCATNRKVACSIPDGVIGIFHWYNPFGRLSL
jgi:hypothetical protein